MDLPGSASDEEQIEDLFQILESIEQGLVHGDTEMLSDAGEKIDQVSASLSRRLTVPEVERTRLSAAVATLRGHLARWKQLPAEADDAYAEALNLIEPSCLEPSVAARRAASLWTYRGIGGLLDDSVEGLSSAVGHFDKAIELRTRDGMGDSANRWGLAAAWMNRGDALGRIGGLLELEEKIRSNETAVSLLDDFPPDDNPAYRVRFALAQMNRADAMLILTTRYGKSFRAEVIAAFLTAVETLRAGALRGEEESRRVLAVALTNLARARLLMENRGSPLVEDAAREAMKLLSSGALDLLEGDLVTLELTARLTLCRALGDRETPCQPEEVTDLVEEGLELIRKFREKGGNLSALGGIASELFRCGAESYLRNQPQFLADYLLDYLDPSSVHPVLADDIESHEIAVTTLWNGAAEIQRAGFSDIGSSGFDKNRDLLASWHECRERLAAIREARIVY